MFKNKGENMEISINTRQAYSEIDAFFLKFLATIEKSMFLLTGF